MDLNEVLPATDHVARLHIVEGRRWSAFWIRAPVGIDLLGLFAFGDRLIGRTSDSGSENPGSTPGPQAILCSIFGGRLIGRTSDFESENLGSMPSPQANLFGELTYSISRTVPKMCLVV